MSRFTIKPAVASDDRLLMAMIGAQNSGKTFSALRVATGIVQAGGGKICVIDTENRRSLRYASRFQFDHIDFQPPFNPASYQEAIIEADKAGYSVIIVDSTSHEHEGPGGVLEMHENNLQKMAGDDFRRRDKMTYAAWIKPKAERNRLLMYGLQRTRAHVILCFRAKEKISMIKNDKGKIEPVPQGWQLIGGDEFGFEMNTIFTLPPGSKGCPDWTSKSSRINDADGKLTSILHGQKQLSEETGRLIYEHCRAEIPPKDLSLSENPTELEVEEFCRDVCAEYQRSQNIDQIVSVDLKNKVALDILRAVNGESYEKIREYVKNRSTKLQEIEQ